MFTIVCTGINMDIHGIDVYIPLCQILSIWSGFQMKRPGPAAGVGPLGGTIWNPVHLNVNRQIGMHWYVLVRTRLYQYQQVQEFPNWYKLVQA